MMSGRLGLATHDWENILHIRQLELVNQTEHILCIYRYINANKRVEADNSAHTPAIGNIKKF